MKEFKDNERRTTDDATGLFLLVGAVMTMCLIVLLLTVLAWTLSLVVGIVAVLLAAVLMVMAHRKFTKRG